MKRTKHRVTAKGGLYLRAGASQDSAALCVLPYNATVERISTRGDWYHCTYMDYDGYCMRKFTEKTDGK